MNLTKTQYFRLACRMLPWLVCVGSALAADQALFDFGRATGFARFQTTDTTVTAVKAGSGMAMRMTTGTSQPWDATDQRAVKGRTID